MQPSAEDIEKAKAAAAGREVHQLTYKQDGEEFSVICAAPSEPEYSSFTRALTSCAKEDTPGKMLAMQNFVLSCAKWPERATIQGFFARKFASAPEFSEQLGEIVGAGATITRKKL